MPIVDASVLQLIDGFLLAAGGLYALYAAGRLWQAGRTDDPLAAAPAPVTVSPWIAFGVLFAYTFALASGLPQQMMGVPSVDESTRTAAELLRPGNDAWFRAVLADMAVKLVAVVVAWRLLRGGAAGAGTAAGWLGRALGIGLAAILVCHTQVYAIGVAWQWLDPSFTPPPHAVLEAITNNHWGPAGVAVMLAAAVVAAPLFEELYYRGLLLGAGVRAFGYRWVSVVFSAVFFGVMHLEQPQAVLPLITLGLILGYVRIQSGRLWVCVVIHALFNARTMVLALLNPELIRGW